MEHKGTITLETERLILRKFNLEDSEASFRNWTHDEKVTEFLTWPTHQTVDTTKMILQDWVESYAHDDFYQWAIVLKDMNEPIGTISIVEQNEEVSSVQIGYCIGSQWWHQGIVSEAFLAIISFLFEQVKVNRIVGRHDPLNPNSGKVMIKCGLTYEGTLREADMCNKGITDISIYSILAREYFHK